MGDVYLALDPRLDRRVALKELADELALSPEAIERFKREAKVLASIDHPGIVTLFGIESTSRAATCLVMEYIDGRSLLDVKKELDGRGETLGPDELLEIALPLCDAVGAAHERGICHRDLKPSNVMLNRENRVKVLDFGLAKQSPLATRPPAQSELPTRAAAGSELTASGQVLGTLTYMSPEQARGEPADQRSDVFSLGVVFFELLCGMSPFAGETAAERISAMLRDPPRSAVLLAEGVPASISAILDRCLEKDPADRFSGAKALGEALRAAASEGLVGGVATPEAGGKWLKRGLAVALAVVAAVGVVALLPGERTQQGSGVSTEPAERAKALRGFPLGNPQTFGAPGFVSSFDVSPDGQRVIYSRFPSHAPGFSTFH